MWSADTSPLSPPPPAGARYEPADPSPALLRATTCSNSAFQLLDSPGGGSGDGSPLRQPIRLLPPKAPAGAAAPDVGHLLARGSGSLEVEVGAGAYEAAAWAKRRSSLADAPPASPRIAAGRAPPAAAQLQQPWPGPQDSPEQPPSARPLLRASAASEAGSYIEWSLSTASVGGGWQPPSGPPAAEPSSTAAHRVSHFSVSQHAEAATPREGEELPACSAAGGASTGSDELPSRGHIIAPAAPRYLWSPSTQGDGVAASPPGSSNALAAGSPPLGKQAAGPGSQLVDSPSSPTGGSRSRWHLSRNRRWEQHPIFGLSRDDGALGAAPGSAADTAGVAAGAAAATIDGQPWEPALIDSPASATASPALPAWVLAAPPGADPPSPSLPPLQPSASPDMLPRSAAAHSRVHSAVLPQAAAGGAGQELAGHDPAWSITNSHIDFKLLDSRSSLGASVQGGGAAGSPSPAHQHARPPFLGPGPGSGSPEAAAPVSPTAATAPTEVGGWVGGWRSATAGGCRLRLPSQPVQVWAGAASLCNDSPGNPASFSALQAMPHLPGLLPGTYAAALQRFKHVDISRIKRHVGSSPSRKRLALPLLQRLAGSCFNPAGGRLRWRLGRQRVRLLILARMPYNADDPLHYSAFQAVVAGFGGG